MSPLFPASPLKRLTDLVAMALAHRKNGFIRAVQEQDWRGVVDPRA